MSKTNEYKNKPSLNNANQSTGIKLGVFIFLRNLNTILLQ